MARLGIKLTAESHLFEGPFKDALPTELKIGGPAEDCISEKEKRKKPSARQESNPRPLDYEALPMCDSHSPVTNNLLQVHQVCCIGPTGKQVLKKRKQMKVLEEGFH